MILEPGCDFCVSTKDEHDWCSISIPNHKIARGGDVVGPPSGSEKMKCRVTRPNPQLAEQFRAFVGQLMTNTVNCSSIESGPAAKAAAAEALKISSLVIGQGAAGKLIQQGRPKLLREEIIRRAKELLEVHKDQHILVEELAAAVGVSVQTLRRAFNDYFGVGPSRYLQLRQIHQVHHVLWAAQPDAVSVSDVMVAYGVWHFSRFASRYRQVFGELPSETLRKKRGSLVQFFRV